MKTNLPASEPTQAALVLRYAAAARARRTAYARALWNSNAGGKRPAQRPAEAIAALPEAEYAHLASVGIAESVLAAGLPQLPSHSDGAKSLAACLQAALSAANVAPPTAEHAQFALRQAHALATLHLGLHPYSELPARLRELASPPPYLCSRGGIALLERRPMVAIIGSRRAGVGALKWAHQLATTLARAGVAIVSGGAFGVDSAAHQGALDGGGPTLAVVGSAIDRLYPRGNAELYQRMLAAGGAIVSEHAPLAETFASSHALRNRLIACLADAVVVAEAGAKSGTAGAVRYALELQRPVWVSPHEVGGERGGIVRWLQSNTATVLKTASDLNLKRRAG